MDRATPSEAVRAFVASISEALSCVTDERFIVTDAVRPRYAAALHSGRQTPIPGPLPLTIGVRQLFETVPTEDSPTRYRASTTHYSYRLHLRQDIASPEVIAFQWDRDALAPRPNHPHLHLGAAMTSGSPLLDGLPARFNKIHVPTGRLSLETVLIFAIEELGVLPSHGRAVGPILAQLREADWGRRLS